MRNDYYSYSKDYINRWVISYADFMTVLLALFMVMWAFTSMQSDKTQTTSEIKSLTNKETNIQSEKDKIFEVLSKNPSIKNNVQTLKSDRGVILRLNDKMLFNEGSAIIKPEVLDTLDNISKELSALDNHIIIEGHTDSTPINTAQFPSNWELSTARATNIIKYMVVQNKLDPKKLSAVGYGEYMPIALNTTYEGKTKNRRVDIIILSSNN